MSADVLIAGETLVDFLPDRSGPLEAVSTFERRPGGAPANVAVALARLERTPLFWTRVGDDPFGRDLRRTLEEHGLPGRFLETDPDAHTTLAFLERGEADDRAFTFYRDGAADTRLEPGRVDDAALAELAWVHAGGVALAAGRSRAATLDLLERADERGCTVSFDPNVRPALWPSGETLRETVREALASVDVLKATREELETLGFAGETDAALARDATRAGPTTVLLTRGERGALGVATADSPVAAAGTASHPGYDADAVDPTGAGDAFVAGSIAALSSGRGLEEAVAFADAVGAAATTASGAMAALPDRETVRSLEREG